MTLAATAPVDNVTNATAAWVVLALLAVFAICAVLYQHERVSDRQTARIDTHDEQLAELAYQMPALLDWLGIEIPPPVADDSPDALEDLEPDTDEFPAIPDTEPMALIADPTPAVQARRDAAWDQQRPTPERRYPEEFPAPTDSDDVKAQRAAWVEDQLREIRARIDAAQGAS